jgi:RNA polymerase sigma-70 factor (ECF subfamily)
MDPAAGNVTRLLKAWRNGDAEALAQIAPLVEAELRRLARNYLRREGPNRTLQPTELINEAYARLIEWNAVEWQDRSHFLAVASKIMRRVLVNRALARKRHKRGGSAVLVSLSEAGDVSDRATDLLRLDEALTELATFDERKCQVVELRFFSGLTVDETAHVLGVSARTVHREWDLAKAWLFRELVT